MHDANDQRIQSGQELRAALVKLASTNLERGIFHEPRGFFDVIEVTPSGAAGTIVNGGNPEVFHNGEEFPVTLTHMLASPARLDTEGNEVDERFIQNMNLRMEFHNQFYMNPDHIPIPLWGNKVVAAAQSVSFGTSAWGFDVPFILSTRDTMLVDVLLDEAPDDTTKQVSVTFTGIGLTSGRPYLMQGTDAIGDAIKHRLGTTFFRNDGSEPIIVTDMTANVSGDEDNPDPTGDIRGVSFQVRQAGNGLNAEWFQGPIALPNGQLIPGTLLGQRSGRAVVHQFPEPLVWEPGEGINMQVIGSNFGDDVVPFLHIGLLGFITVS